MIYYIYSYICVCIYLESATSLEHLTFQQRAHTTFFTHSSPGGHFGWFHIIFGYLNGAIVTTGVHLFDTMISFPLNMHPLAGLLDSMVVFFVVLQGLFVVFSIAILMYATQEHKSSPFSASLPAFICCLFDNGHSNDGEATSHCGFDLHFSWWLVILSTISYSFWSLHIFW